ncbi:bacterial Ig-like domain-containing protein [Gottfriedia acidiceleris]|uniref:bacterial Ig-like domain-containing protein n=1 Tax=Gottfriedia acidiceleris TaxID=371036 RepID=UPI0013EB21B0|nr:bacterial Ig-like domain-containing protein [Gottfriedia acidiceleris]
MLGKKIKKVLRSKIVALPLSAMLLVSAFATPIAMSAPTAHAAQVTPQGIDELTPKPFVASEVQTAKPVGATSNMDLSGVVGTGKVSLPNIAPDGTLTWTGSYQLSDIPAGLDYANAPVFFKAPAGTKSVRYYDSNGALQRLYTTSDTAFSVVSNDTISYILVPITLFSQGKVEKVTAPRFVFLDQDSVAIATKTFKSDGYVPGSVFLTGDVTSNASTAGATPENIAKMDLSGVGSKISINSIRTSNITGQPGTIEWKGSYLPNDIPVGLNYANVPVFFKAPAGTVSAKYYGSDGSLLKSYSTDDLAFSVVSGGNISYILAGITLAIDGKIETYTSPRIEFTDASGKITTKKFRSDGLLTGSNYVKTDTATNPSAIGAPIPPDMDLTGVGNKISINSIVAGSGVINWSGDYLAGDIPAGLKYAAVPVFFKAPAGTVSAKMFGSDGTVLNTYDANITANSIVSGGNITWVLAPIKLSNDGANVIYSNPSFEFYDANGQLIDIKRFKSNGQLPSLPKPITIHTIQPKVGEVMDAGLNPVANTSLVVKWSTDNKVTWKDTDGLYQPVTQYWTRYVYTADRGFKFDSTISKTNITVPPSPAVVSYSVIPSSVNRDSDTLTIDVKWAVTGSLQFVDGVSIGTAAPVAGAEMADGINTVTTGLAATPTVTWSKNDGASWSAASGNYAGATTYKTKYVYTAETGYSFNENSTVTGVTGGVVDSVVRSGPMNNILTIIVTWNPTEAATLSSISIASPPYKTDYIVGDELDIAGLRVSGLYSDTYTRFQTITMANISGFDPSKVGTQTITVTVGEKTATFDVTVSLHPDQVAANDVISAINALPTTITLKDKEAVNAAKTKYNGLTSAQKLLVTNYSKLTTALSVIASLENQAAAKVVIDQINALTPTIANKAKYIAAQTAYNALSADQKKLVTNYNKVTSGLSIIAGLEKIAADKTKPVISGVVSGKTYKVGTIVKYSDNLGIKSALLNNKTFVSGTAIKVAGTYTLVVTDKNNNVTTVKFTIKAIPALPTINTVTTKSTSVTGKAEKGCTVTVKVGIKIYKAVSVSSNGTYTVKITKPTKNTVITVTVKDALGQTSTKTYKVTK